MKKNIFCAIILLSSVSLAAQTPFEKIEFVNFSKVNITDNFWKPKIDKVAMVTIPVCIDQTEVKTPRIKNFEKVARKKGEKHEGIFYDDSDVYKALEAIAYSLKTNPNKTLEAKADEWIDKIAAAQQPDGYLNTMYTLNEPQNRYTDMSMHEDYNCGHLIEAAVAYYNVTGKRKFLDVAIKWADHFDALFGPTKKHWVTGHQELELALVKLYRVTNTDKYLKLADWLLSERGHRYAKGYTWTDWKDTAYAQDVLPVKEQKQITGHAVRAMYMYTGAADVAAQTGDAAYMSAMKSVWEDVVFRNMYITGGIGSSGSNEGFSNDYDLPNENAYCETCASVGMVFWNQRMAALTGESMYMDVLEKSLYNGALDGLSLDGDHFFYGNPLASNGRHSRREWFGTACCPANIARLIASLGNYIYAQSNDGIWINLFAGSNTSITMPKGNVDVKMETNYPWDGTVKINVSTVKKMRFNMHLRIPGYVNGIAAPGALYHFADTASSKPIIKINGVAVSYTVQKGYAVINREWKKDDVVEMTIPMAIKKIIARDELKQDNDRMALQLGPLIYCFEGADNNGKAWNFIMPANADFKVENFKVKDESVIALVSNLPVVNVNADGTALTTGLHQVKAIPYYTWCNRGSNPMQVWLPVKIKDIKINN
ncbi:glycoside hydrolase family 127 protein [Ferruginibacter sp.]|nr:glycoside hydrolase family 127 protein [Ferruginibacter sp.]